MIFVLAMNHLVNKEVNRITDTDHSNPVSQVVQKAIDLSDLADQTTISVGHI